MMLLRIFMLMVMVSGWFGWIATSNDAQLKGTHQVAAVLMYTVSLAALLLTWYWN